MTVDGKRREAVDELCESVLYRGTIQACHSYPPVTLSCRYVQMFNVLGRDMIRNGIMLEIGRYPSWSLQSSR